MSTPYQKQFDVLQDLKIAYESKGYRFYVEPKGSFLPNELADFRPDAIAISDNERIIIEVINKAAKNYKKKVKQIREQMSLVPGNWKLEIVSIDGISEDEFIIPSEATLYLISSQIRDLLEQDFIEPTILMCFAAIEGVGRMILQKNNTNFDKRLAGYQLFATLEENGFITARNSKFLRRMWEGRNLYAHGYFSEANFRDVDAERLKNLTALLYNEADVPFSVS